MTEDPIRDLSGAELQAFLHAQDWQARAEPGRDPPRLRSGAGGYRFTLFLMDPRPADPARFSALQFQAGFTVTLARPRGLRVTNDWNCDRWWTKAFLDERDQPCLILDVPLMGGVTSLWLQGTLRRWTRDLDDYARAIFAACEG